MNDIEFNLWASGALILGMTAVKAIRKLIASI